MTEYFSHDYNARNDQKLVSIKRRFGMEGIGIYWCLIEIMYECYGNIHEDKLDDIAYDLRVELGVLKQIIETELFKKRGKNYYSDSVKKRLKQREEKSNKARASAVKSWQSRNKPNANAEQTQSERNANKVKESKVKESKGKYYYIDQILNEFVEAYAATGNHYEVLNKGKERAAIGKLLGLYKKKYPESTSEETKQGLRAYFDAVVNVPDGWLRNNISPSIIMSKFNEINTILKNGKTKSGGKGATDRELAELVAKHFGEQK